MALPPSLVGPRSRVSLACRASTLGHPCREEIGAPQDSESLTNKINTNGKRQAPLGQTQAKETSLAELKKECDERKGDLGRDTPQNGESERRRLTVSVQYNWWTGTLNLSDMSNQVTENWSAWARIAISSHHKNSLHYYLPALDQIPGSSGLDELFYFLASLMFWWETLGFWSSPMGTVHH